jgi:2-C-methyl-D-erythritol 4-phosphate cytidylyltransferase
MAASLPKQYLPLAGVQVIDHTLARLCAHPQIEQIVVVLRRDDPYWCACRFAQDPRVLTAEGGDERCHSVLNGLLLLEGLADAHDWVLVHDAARPCLRPGDIDRLLDRLCQHPIGGLLAVPVNDTVKRADSQGRVQETINRAGLWRAFTPQMFRLSALRRALEHAIARNTLVTDEAAAMERMGLTPCLVEGHADNIKITRPQDLLLAEFFLRQQERADAHRSRL